MDPASPVLWLRTTVPGKWRQGNGGPPASVSPLPRLVEGVEAPPNDVGSTSAYPTTRMATRNSTGNTPDDRRRRNLFSGIGGAILSGTATETSESLPSVLRLCIGSP